MISLILCIIALVLGYLLYGKLVERVFGPDISRQTPAIAKADGVDFVEMPTWKVFTSQGPDPYSGQSWVPNSVPQPTCG